MLLHGSEFAMLVDGISVIFLPETCLRISIIAHINHELNDLSRLSYSDVILSLASPENKETYLAQNSISH